MMKNGQFEKKTTVQVIFLYGGWVKSYIITNLRQYLRTVDLTSSTFPTFSMNFHLNVICLYNTFLAQVHTLRFSASYTKSPKLIESILVKKGIRKYSQYSYDVSKALSEVTSVKETIPVVMYSCNTSDNLDIQQQIKNQKRRR